MATAIAAGTLITRLRAKIPDSVFVAGVPQPTMDGKFRVQTLYAWLDDAIKELTRYSGWTVEDWWAMPQVEFQPFYELDERFHSIIDAFANQFRLDVHDVNEGDTLWPGTSGPVSTQPLAAYQRRLATALEVGFWPTPNMTDPTVTLTVPTTETGPDPITVDDTSEFLSYGYVMIEDELIAYQQIVSATQIGVISRGQGGTTPVAHLAGVDVRHLGLWVKGKRTPTEITGATSPVEVPRGWMNVLENYVLGNCRLAQKGRAAEGERLLAGFTKACEDIDKNPNWKVNQGQIRAYGEPAVGPLYGGGQGLIVP